MHQRYQALVTTKLSSGGQTLNNNGKHSKTTQQGKPYKSDIYKIFLLQFLHYSDYPYPSLATPIIADPSNADLRFGLCVMNPNQSNPIEGLKLKASK